MNKPIEARFGKEAAAKFENEGFIVLKGFLDIEKLLRWENTIASIYAMQALKIKPLREKLTLGLDPARYTGFEELSKILRLFEDFDKTAAYQALLMCTRSVAAHDLLAEKRFREACAVLMGCPEELILYGALSFFVNIPGVKRTATKWHSEASYYPKRRAFLNIWIPTFTDKRRNGGTMWVRPGSHKKEHWDFAEYFGHDDESFNAKNHIKQLEVPDEDLKPFAMHAIEASRGDVVFFQRNLVHATGENKTKDVSVATVVRAFDYRRDLSLDANASAGMGFPDFARPGTLPLN